MLLRCFFWMCLMGTFSALMLWFGRHGNIFLIIIALFSLFLLFWGVLFARPPGITLKDSCVVLSLYFFKKKIPYNSIRSISVLKTRTRFGGMYGNSNYVVSPTHFYYVVIAFSIIFFIIIYSKETFYRALKLGSLLLAVLIAIAVIYHLVMVLISKLISRISLVELNLNIAIDPKALDVFPFSHYNKYPLEFRLNLPLLDITKNKCAQFIANIETKINPKALHPTAINFKKKALRSKDGG